MNYWYLLNYKEISSIMTIPSFGPDSLLYNLYLYKVKIDNNKWKFDYITNDFIDFEISSENFEIDCLFFLYDQKLDYQYSDHLIHRTNFLNTSPSYRANISIKIDDLKTCYQGEYSSFMFDKKGSVLSFPLSCMNKEFDNYIILTNYVSEPIKKDFKVFLFDIKNNQIISEMNCKTNQSNFFKLDNSMIYENCIIFSYDYLCAPQFLSFSSLEGTVSFEHTQPPHTYIWESNYISKLKYSYNKLIKENILIN